MLPHCCIRSYDCLTEQVECRHPRIAPDEVPTLSPTPMSTSIPFVTPPSSSAQFTARGTVESTSMSLAENQAAQGSASTSAWPKSPKLPSSTDTILEPAQSAPPTTPSEREESVEESVDSRLAGLSLFPCTMCRDKKVRVRRL